MIIKSDLTVVENRACNIHTYRSTNTAEQERVFFKRSLRQGTVFFRNGFHRGGVVSKHDLTKGEIYPSGENGREVPTELFFSKTDFTKGELRSNAITPRDKFVKTDHRQGGSVPSSRIKCSTGIRFQNRIDRTSSWTAEASFCFSVNADAIPTWDSRKLSDAKIYCPVIFCFGEKVSTI